MVITPAPIIDKDDVAEPAIAPAAVAGNVIALFNVKDAAPMVNVPVVCVYKLLTVKSFPNVILLPALLNVK